MPPSMWSSVRHLPELRKVLASLGRAALGAAGSRFQRTVESPSWALLKERVWQASAQAPSERLARDFQVWIDDLVGAPVSCRPRMALQVPPTLFPQWGVPLMSEALAALGQPLTRVLNAGCTLELHRPVRPGQALQLSAHLVDYEERERSLRVSVSLETFDDAGELLLRSSLRVSLPRSAPSTPKAAKKKKPAPLAPGDARVVRRLKLGPRAGLSFATLTGDFNPIHWLPLYARLAGFRSPILQGYGSFALAVGALQADRLTREQGTLQSFEARFTRPLLLPQAAQVMVSHDRLLLGEGPGGMLYLDGHAGPLNARWVAQP